MENLLLLCLLIIRIFSYVMIPIQKLKSNLKESQNWETTFRQEIKLYLQEITSKNQEICQLTKGNINLHSEIQKKHVELKSLTEDRQKIIYKTDKIKIKIEEVQNRLKVYEEGCKKKQQWVKQLKRKVNNLEELIKKEKIGVFESEINEDYFDDAKDCSLSNISCYTVSVKSNLSQSKATSQKQTKRQIKQTDINLKKLKELQRSYWIQIQRCKQADYKIDLQNQKQKRLKQILNQMEQKNGLQNKENIGFINHSLSSIPVKTNQIQSLKRKIVELQLQSQKLNTKISTKHSIVQKYADILQKITLHDSQFPPISKETMNLQRQVKRQRNAMLSIGSYLLKQTKQI